MKKLIIYLVFVLSPVTGVAQTSIDAQVIRNQSGSGSTFISSGFPFPPGLVPESVITLGAIRVVVGGSEVAANVSALRGRHKDGTVRSALIQFTVPNMTQGDTLAAQVVVDGGTRSSADPEYVRPTLTLVQNNNVILPTDTDYLTSTLITFQPLLPFGDGTVTEEAQYTSLAGDRFDALLASETLGTDVNGTARYEEVRGMLTMWARGGESKYFNQAVKKTLEWLPYNTPINNSGCVAEPYINPDNRPTTTTNTTCGLSPEWQFSRMFSYASMYLLTGYRDFWSYVSYYVQRQQAAIVDQSTAFQKIIRNIDLDFPRFNYAERYGAMLAAFMIDATAPISGDFHTGRQLIFKAQFEYVLNTLEASAWNLKWIPFGAGSGTVPGLMAPLAQGAATCSLLGVYADRNGTPVATGQSMPTTGWLQVRNITGTFTAGALSGVTATASGAPESDYREGISGVLSYSPRTGVHTLPSFQLVFPAYFLIDYYLNIEGDERIPPMVKKITDTILENIRVMVPGDAHYQHVNSTWGNPIYGKPYDLEIPVTTETAYSYELPEYARLIAFVLKTSGEATVNGANYTTWYNRVIDTANNSPSALTWQWKLFGQFYGFGADAPWMMAQSSLPAPVYREPALHSSIPGDAPDLSRSRSLRLFRNVRVSEVEP